jgi:hypothetical protein
MKVLEGTVRFTGRYIAEPYWPEQALCIDIDKQSGVSRARSEATRVKALDAELKKRGMTLDEFRKLQELAKRPFFTVADLPAALTNKHDPREIIIPADRMLACFVQACDEAPAAVRVAKPENLRSVLKLDPIFTGKLAPDGEWTRAVVPKKDGKPLSNQRGSRTSLYIETFEARIAIRFSEAAVTEKRLRDFVEWAGREIGVGAARKMNCGRFTVRWEGIAAMGIAAE